MHRKKVPYSCGMMLIFLGLFAIMAWGAPPRPSVISAKVGKRELKGVPRVMITQEGLTGSGEILIVGIADGGGPSVAKVEVSLDDGQTWRAATGQGKWQYRFIPLPNFTYHVIIRVINVAGVISDTEAYGLTKLTYLPIALSELIQQRADKLAKVYMSKDLEFYMHLISRQYQISPRGWHRLRGIIDSDFKSLNNIVLRFTVNQVFELEKVIVADIHWKLTHAGLTAHKEGYVEMHFDPADQLKILAQKRDLYFGLPPGPTP